MKEQKRAKQLCWEYNRTAPDEQEKRKEILQKLLGTCDPMTGIEPDFHCDYGFNNHTHGLVVINYNCVILDTSPVHIGGEESLSRRAYVWHVPDTQLILCREVRELELRHQSRLKRMSGSGQISLVCVTDEVPENVIRRDDGWKAIRIQGVLDFSLIGILAKIAGILAENGISIFAVSTYNTDYILLKKEKYQKALEVLADSGYEIVD